MKVLFLRIFAGVLLAVVASQALGFLIMNAQFRADRARMMERLSLANVDTLAEQLATVQGPEDRQRLLDEFQARTGLRAEVRRGPAGPRGKQAPPLFEGKGKKGKGKKGKFKGKGKHPPPLVTVPVGPHRHLVVTPSPPAPMPGGPLLFVGLGGLVFIVAGVCWALAAPVVRDLQALEATVARLGSDDLGARAEVPHQGAVRPLAEGVNIMADRVQRLVTGQRHLFQAVSHEIRTPNARIRFLLEALRDAETAEERERLVRSAEDDLEEVDALLDELLTLLRFDVSGVVEMVSPYALDEALDEAAERVRPLRSEITVRVSVDAEGTPQVPRRWFLRALENLLTNAVRFAATEASVTARVEGDRLVVDIDDDGPGVPEGDRDRIFEPFASGDPSRDRKLGGVGLGLAIVSRIVERHGGRITVGASEAGGARFRTSWPVA